MRKEILKKLENEEFAKKIIRMKSKEEVKKALNDKKIIATDEEINELGGLLKEIISKLEVLPEDQLQSIAGGVKVEEVDDIGQTLSVVPTTYGGGQKQAGEGGGFWSSAAQSATRLAPAVVGFANKILDLKSAQANAAAQAKKSDADIASLNARTQLAQTGGIFALVVAAAGGVYLFRNEIRGWWSSK